MLFLLRNELQLARKIMSRGALVSKMMIFFFFLRGKSHQHHYAYSSFSVGNNKFRIIRARLFASRSYNEKDNIIISRICSINCLFRQFLLSYLEWVKALFSHVSSIWE